MNRPTQIAIDKCQEQLRADGIPHAVATVVRTLSSTAAKPGMKAIVLESGEFAEGWLGGGCVTSAVRRAAPPCRLDTEYVIGFRRMLLMCFTEVVF